MSFSTLLQSKQALTKDLEVASIFLCHWALTLGLSLLGTLINGYLVRTFQAEGMKHIGCVDTDPSEYLGVGRNLTGPGVP